MKTPLDAPEKQIAEETSAPSPPRRKRNPSSTLRKCRRAKPPRLIWPKVHAIRSTNGAASPATCLSAATISTASFPTRRRARRIARRAKPFLTELREYLEANVDADEIDRTGEIPQKNIDDLFAMGAFAIKIPKQYGGLGLSQVNYGRAAMLLGQLGREPDRARLGASIDRRAAAAPYFSARKNKRRNICRASRARRSPPSP